MKIRFKLLLMSFIQLLFVTAMFVSYYIGTNKVTTIGDLDEDALMLTSHILNTTIEEKKMLLSPSVETESNFKKYISDASHTLNDLYEEEYESKSKDKLKKITSMVNTYEEEFYTLVELIRKRGTNENEGIIGDFRDKTHAVEDILKDGSDSLMVSLLLCRRHEKDYMLRGNSKYISRLTNETEVLKSLIKKEYKKNSNNIISELEKYKEGFLRLTAIDSEIKTISANLEKHSENILPEIESYREGVDERHDKYTKFISSLGLIFVVIIAFIGIVLSTLMARMISRPIKTVTSRLKDIAEGEGDLSKRIKITSNDEISEMSSWINSVLDRIEHMVILVKQNVKGSKLTGEELSSNMTEEASTVNEMVMSIKSMETNINTQNEQVERSALSNEKLTELVKENSSQFETVAEKTEDFKKKIENQAASVGQIAASIEEMTSTIQSVSNVTSKADESTGQMHKTSEISRELMEKTAENMKEVLVSVDTIGDFVSAIVSIASQTNLLAMNAAIEAAHAGEHGRGFAVVAEEIRKLSDLSNQQAEEAQRSLKGIKDSVNTTAEDLNATEENFSLLIAEVEKVSTIVSQVRRATEEQSVGASEIVKAISQVEEITTDVSHTYEDINLSLNAVRGNAMTIYDLVSENARILEKLRSMSHEVSGSISEMSVGAEELNKAVQSVLSLTEKNTEGLTTLEAEVALYKTSEGGGKEQKMLPTTIGESSLLKKE